ncbi:trithorax group protein osa isoform X4 [Hermetia illucens]|uniref:trithorax group protein osa isoform X4 n=1 Tax=Hermetia illucens TaxID=343691 RepID=UPI0018CC22A8|nr:trithorax group protein osa isoform X4 [Hermetia illucens]
MQKIMAQQQTESLNDVKSNEELAKSQQQQQSLQNGTEPASNAANPPSRSNSSGPSSHHQPPHHQQQHQQHLQHPQQHPHHPGHHHLMQQPPQQHLQPHHMPPHPMAGRPPPMNDKNSTKSPPNQGGPPQQGPGMMPSGAGGPPPPQSTGQQQPPNNGDPQQQQQSHPYDPPPPPHVMQHYPPPHPSMTQQQGGGPPGSGGPENPNKDDPYGPPPPHPYGRYHHPHDPNVGPDPYGRYGHPGMQPGGKPGIMPPNRPPQRYIPGQPPQGPTPTLNSLLQSHPPPPHGPQHRYPNSYGDPQQQPQQPGQQQQQPPGPQQQQQQPGQQPPPPPQSYGPQQGWAPPPRPYSPQLGPSQQYRTPPPLTSSSTVSSLALNLIANTSRGQSPYPPSGQSPGSYPPSPQQGGPPPPSGQGPPVSSQYSPYPQRYPTPPGPGGGPNHRSPYPPHQYPEPNRPWPGAPSGPSPAASPGPAIQTAGGHPHPPASPHQQQQQHGGPTTSSSNSPGHAPSPSPQPPQPSPSPHQYPNRPSQASTPNTNTDIESGELIGQNSNDSSSCGGIGGGLGSGPPGTPNSQQAMRPTPSPTGSSGSRSMSPAVGQPNLPMPPRPSSSSQAQAGVNQLPPTSGGILSNNSNLVNAQQPHHHQQQQQPPHPHHHQQQPPHQQQQLHPQHPQHHPSQQHLPPTHLHQQHQQHQQQQSQQQPPPQQQPLDPSSIAGSRSQTSTGSNSGGGPPGGGGAPPGSQQPPQAGTIPPHQQQQSQQQQPPGSQQAAGGQPGSNMAAQGSYQTPPPQISHMHAYKMGPSPGQGPGPGPQSMSPYPPPQSQQYSQGSYPPRPPYPSNYGPTPPAGQPPPTSNMPPGPGQYPNRPLPNHVGGPHSQFPPYQTGWTPPSPQGPGMMSNHVQGKGTPPPSQANVAGSPRQLNYLKQHLQHKGGYAGQQSPTPPQGYGNGPAMHPPMGPPHHMGPPLGPTSMGPPTSAPQSTPPPSVTPTGANSHPDGSSTPDPSMSQDNGVSSSGSSTTSSHPVTSVVTTGPDGTPLDEASQQSTLSNASAASGEDPQCVTPKSRKNETAYSQSHLAPPTASPGAHPHNEDFEMNSPSSWPRTAASPVFNSHVPAETYRSTSKVTKKKSDSLCKLYDMDDNPDRRTWLDKLLSFMEERRTPITACPTISKQPLDLYRLYLLVKERGGFVEVCKVTKSKTWKDIAGLLGIGASSSAAYTLRKHYTKNLLAFECHFDRGDIDPLPIIQQVEAGSKKKQAKAASVPSPVGSSNSQDSFPTPGATGTSMDGYPGYPSNYPPGTQPDYNTPPQMQRPPSQNNAQAPHTGNTQQTAGDNISVSNPFDDPVGTSRGAPYPQGTTYPPVSRPQGAPYQGQPGGYNQYGANEQYGPAAPPGQYPPTQGQFPPPNRTMYPSYEGDSNTPPTSNTYPPYGPQPPRPYNQPPAGAAQPPVPPTSGTQNPPGAPGSYPPVPPQQEYYRQPEQNAQPRRHPDFAKDTQPYPPYGQRPQMYGGWPNNTGQYRGQYPPQPGPQQWNSGQRPPVPPAPGQPSPVQWAEQHRYPPQNQQQYPPAAASQQPPQWGNMSSPATPTSQTSPLRPPQRSSGKPFMPPPQPASVKPTQPQPAAPQPGFQAPAQQQKREIVFPPDSVEATTPVLYRRKRLGKAEVCPVDPWRIFMSLKSGLLAESTWALDILNILLFDDSAVHYFGLAHLPGLLNLLMDHFQKNLSDMFDPDAEDKHGYGWNCLTRQDEETPAVDFGQITEPPSPDERVLILTSSPNYTMVSRKGVPVRIQNAEEDIFVSDLPRKWDHDSNKNYQLSTAIGSNPWTYGHVEPHPHDTIMDVFRAETVNIPFSRYIKSDKKDKHDEDLFDEGPHGQDENEQDNCNVKREKGGYTFAYERKRKLAAKNGLTESSKRAKLKEWGAANAGKNAGLDIKAEIKTEVDEAIVIKKEHIDSDCREVDMEIEPRVPNGPQQLESSPDDATSQDEKSKTDSKSPDDVGLSSIRRERCDNADSRKEEKFDPKKTVRDPAAILKRRRMSDFEDECYTRDESSLYLVNESCDTLARRCICISNIFRNLTFVPGNESVLAKSATFLAILGKLLLLHHEHLARTQKTRNYDREEDTDFSDSCSSLQGENEWWWDYLIQIRENMLVAIANIAGHLELSKYDEVITRPVLDGLLHWAVCPSAHGQDPFPSCGVNSSLSPQRLALEALCKLCVTDANVDLVIATPPFSRLEKLCGVLTRHLCRNEEQVLREFSVNLLHYLAAADTAMSRTVALQSPCISYLVAFIEQAEQTALGVANQHGINHLRENPDSMGTSLDMLRRAAGTLLHLARHPDNRPLFMQQEQRLLGLVMSHILDQHVALIISKVLFQVSRGGGPMTSTEFKFSSQYRISFGGDLQERQPSRKKNERDVGKDNSGNSILMGSSVSPGLTSSGLNTSGHGSETNNSSSSSGTSNNSISNFGSSISNYSGGDQQQAVSQQQQQTNFNNCSNSNSSSNCSNSSGSSSSNSTTGVVSSFSGSGLVAEGSNSSGGGGNSTCLMTPTAPSGNNSINNNTTAISSNANNNSKSNNLSTTVAAAGSATAAAAATAATTNSNSSSSSNSNNSNSTNATTAAVA